jgi:phosphoribosylanthranilate isomerase
MGEVEQIKSFSHPALFAVDVNSRFETEPGIKNINELKQFICRLNSN